MANKKTIKYCNEPPALTGHINPDDMRRIFGKVIPLQAPNNPVKPIESTCYYLFKAGVDCLRINEAQNNTKAWYYTSPSIEKYIGHPFSWPLAKGLVTDQNIINMLENGLMPTDMWLRCENCNAYDHYTIMLYYKKVTTSVIQDPYGEIPQAVSCPGACIPPDAPQVGDWIRSGAHHMCPNYYKLKPCVDCAGYYTNVTFDIGEEAEKLNLNQEYYISLPSNQTFSALYPFVRVPKWFNLYDYGKFLGHSSDYMCFSWHDTGIQYGGKNFVPVDNTGKAVDVTAKSWNHDPNHFHGAKGQLRAGGMYAMKTCSDCLNESIFIIEFCGYSCSADDLITAYNGANLVSRVKAWNALKCLKSGALRIVRAAPTPSRIAYGKLNDGKYYLSQARSSDPTKPTFDCVRLRYVPCPNIMIRQWANYFYNDAAKQLWYVSGQFNYAFKSYIYRHSFPTFFYPDCCSCRDAGGALGPKTHCPPKAPPPPPPPPPPPGKPPPPIGRPVDPVNPPVGNPNNGGAPVEMPANTPVYKIKVIETSTGSPFYIWTDTLPQPADYRTSANTSIFTKYRGYYLCALKSTGRRGTDNFWIFDWTCAQFYLDKNYKIVYTKFASPARMGSTPSAAYWEFATEDIYATCGECSSANVGTCHGTC